MGALADRVVAVKQRIAEAAERAGRDPDDVRLVAVGKTKPVELLREAVEAGVQALGENYVQELLAKRQAIGDRVEWHFVGHLQTNKVRHLVPFCSLIHGVDSLKLAQEISRRAEQVGRRQPVLIEVNLSGEQTKFGVAEEDVHALAEAIMELPGLHLRGLMTMPPLADHPEKARPYFRRLRQLQSNLVESGIPADNVRELSMGMTADYEIAIEEGATLVRVGTAIFGARDNKSS